MSSSSSSSYQHVEGGDGGTGEFERPSSSRRRAGDGVWPDHFVETLAAQVAIDASRSVGRLAAAPALFNIFQVCSTWRAVSRSEILWQNLTRRIWNRSHALHHTWRDEYIYRHRTACNFRFRRYIHTTLHSVLPANNNAGLSCRRLALSDQNLAAGFSDGTVRLFHLPTRLHFSTFHPYPRDRLGLFAPAVSGIILSDAQLIFASLDGDVHVATINSAVPLRRTQLGDVLNDGALVDFTGCNRWWVGLYAGVQDRSFHIWDGESEEIFFIGGSLTNTVALNGWRLLTEPTEFVGRVRVTSQETAVACTRLRVAVLDLRYQGIVIREDEFRRRSIVGAVDASNESFVIVNSGGMARVLRVDTLEEVCSFPVNVASLRGLMGCMNGVGVYALTCERGLTTAWDVEHGTPLYDFSERIGEADAMVADDRYVAASSIDGTLHLWDFGAQ